MNKINKTLLSSAIILAVALIGVIYWQKKGFEKPYYAVYLDTGDLYFGQMHFFPRFFLSDVYFLKQNIEDKENPLSLSKFSNAFYGPEDKIYLNKENIIWKAKLRENSQVLQFLKNPQEQQTPSSAQLK